jgi:carboxypeptidase PM20D1
VDKPTDVRVSPASEPREDVMQAIAASIHRMHPGIPVTPYLESGGTDGLVYRNAGIPTFASSGIFMKAERCLRARAERAHPVEGFYQGVDHIHDLALR